MFDLLIAALVLCAVVLRFASVLPVGVRAVLAVLVVVTALLPFPMGLAPWLLSYVSSFSVTSGLLALLAISHRLVGFRPMPEAQLRAACVMLVLLALAFYPMSLGTGYFDPYALGFGSFEMNTALLLLGLLAWVLRYYACCAVLVLAQFAYGAKLLASDNLWDYLLDPMLVGWAVGWLIRERASRNAAPASASIEAQSPSR